MTRDPDGFPIWPEMAASDPDPDPTPPLADDRLQGFGCFLVVAVVVLWFGIGVLVTLRLTGVWK